MIAVAVRMTATLLGGMSGTALPWSCTLQFGATTALDSATLLTVANNIMADLAGSTTFKSGFMNTRTVQAVRLAVHNPDTGPETAAATSTAASVAGTVAGTSPPPQVAAVLTLRTATPGRSFRGRVYFPSLATDQNGSVAGAQATALNAALQALVGFIETRSAAAGANLAWYVWSRVRGAGTPIVQVSVGSRVDTQRRRDTAIETYTNFPVT